MSLAPVSNPRPVDNRPETVLVALARRKDEPAIRELVRRCNQQLFRVARGVLQNDAEAEDVVQAAYVSAFTKLESFRGDAKFVTWLTRITLNEAYACLRRQAHIVDIDDYRKSAADFAEEGTVETLRQSPTTPESEFGRAEVRLFLERAIDALPEPLRLTYVLRDVQEMTAREVATLLGVNALTVKTRLFRARKRLRDEARRTLAAEFSGVFPFDGARCAGMADSVIQALNKRPSGLHRK